MSFQRKPKIIEFPEGHELHGLIVYTRRPRIEQIEAVNALQTDSDEAVRQSIKPIIREVFGPALLSWNYEDEDGRDVPATVDGFLSIDIEAQLHILNCWTASVTGVDAELGKESGSGQHSPARLTDGLPTVSNPALSAALLSLPTHNAS